MELIIKSSRRGSDLTAKLLAFSRQRRADIQPTGVSVMLNDIGEAIRLSLTPRISVKASVEYLPSYAMVDRGLIAQSVFNICQNAQQAMGEKGGTLSIAVEAVDCSSGATNRLPVKVGNLKSGQYLRITISDTGSGIDPFAMERIFDPFFTTKDVGKGTGLGLSAVYGTIMLHNGAIAVENAPGAGAAFALYLPLIKGLSAEKPCKI